MKALSVRNPWATLIADGEKTIECRTWRTNYRGDIIICSSLRPEFEDMLQGHALCIARLEKIEPFTCNHLKDACLDNMPYEMCYAWHLSNIRKIKPFRIKGRLNLFSIDDRLIKITEE